MTSTQVNTFGTFFRSKRISLGLTLRAFCEKYNFDPGNISKLERDILSPTVDREKLESLAVALKISKNTPEWVSFLDLAYSAKGAIPPDIKNNRQTISLLPAFYRTARGKKLTKEKLEKLLELLNSNE
jgi:transcriptional regulator with XRE-family HTH domain